MPSCPGPGYILLTDRWLVWPVIAMDCDTVLLGEAPLPRARVLGCIGRNIHAKFKFGNLIDRSNPHGIHGTDERIFLQFTEYARKSSLTQYQLREGKYYYYWILRSKNLIIFYHAYSLRMIRG